MIAPAVKKGDKALLKWINQEMDTLQKDGFFIQIYEASLQPFYGKELGAENLLYNQE
ncbi:amino acid ABC transporter substrate-binding protein [Helicobacter fennelliae]